MTVDTHLSIARQILDGEFEGGAKDQLTALYEALDHTLKHEPLERSCRTYLIKALVWLFRHGV